MKKSNLIKIFSILLIVTMLIISSTSVFAADGDDGFADLSETLDGGNTSNTNNTNNTLNTTNTNNVNNTLNTNKTNNTNNTNNSSVYNTNNLPKTGIEDSVPVAMLVVVFAISSVYAYKKIKEYKNI